MSAFIRAYHRVCFIWVDLSLTISCRAHIPPPAVNLMSYPAEGLRITTIISNLVRGIVKKDAFPAITSLLCKNIDQIAVSTRQKSGNKTFVIKL